MLILMCIFGLAVFVSSLGKRLFAHDVEMNTSLSVMFCVCIYYCEALLDIKSFNMM